MDPNANLQEQRSIRAVLECLEDEESRLPHLERLADLQEALDEWISKGGFLPAAWQPESRDARKLAEDFFMRKVGSLKSELAPVRLDELAAMLTAAQARAPR